MSDRKSWELTDEQKKEINERNAEQARRWREGEGSSDAEDTGDNQEAEKGEREREREPDDDDVR